MKKRPVDFGLKFMNRVAQSDTIDTLKLRKPIEKLTYKAVRDGFSRLQAVMAKRKPAKQTQDGETKPKLHFNLDLTEEQEMIADMLEQFALEVIRPEAQTADEACQVSEQLTAQWQELGMADMLINEAHGGSATEGSLITQFLITEKLAKGDLSIALALLSSQSFVQVIQDFGSDTQKADWLQRFLDPETAPLCSLALMEPGLEFQPEQLSTQAKKSGNGYKLNGKKTAVALCQEADYFLVFAKERGGFGLYIVPCDAQGLELKQEEFMGLKAANTGTLHLKNVIVPSEAKIGECTLKEQDYQNLLNRARLAWCALACGTAEAVLDSCIEYANQREAFGEPISHRQSVAFMISDMAIELEGMRLMALRAAAKAQHGLAFEQETALAKFQCARMAMKIGTDGVQIYGGHGFTKEYPVERWYRDLRSIACMEGGLLL